MGLEQEDSSTESVHRDDHEQSERDPNRSEIFEEDMRKTSGVHNLKREEWDEDKCRVWLVNNAAFIPRNYNYADGLKHLYPLLQFAFGDENLDLSIGVLWELIEIESPPPYPEALFQKWKFSHLHRCEDFCNPHVPHGNTIARPTILTERLRKWREDNRTPETTQPNRSSATNKQSEATIVKLRTYKPASAYVHLYNNWRNDSLNVSIGGSPATPYLPKPAEKHKMEWDESYGRGGKLQGVREVPIEELIQENARLRQQNTGLSLDQPQKQKTVSQLLHKIWSRRKGSAQPEAPEGKERTHTIFEDIPDFDVAKHHASENFPIGAMIPNGNFARKYDMFPPWVPLAESCIITQPTACQKQDDGIDRLREEAIRAAEESRQDRGLDMSISARKLFNAAMSTYCHNHLSASMWFDSKCDFYFESKKKVSSATLEEGRGRKPFGDEVKKQDTVAGLDKTDNTAILDARHQPAPTLENQQRQLDIPGPLQKFLEPLECIRTSDEEINGRYFFPMPKSVTANLTLTENPQLFSINDTPDTAESLPKSCTLNQPSTVADTHQHSAGPAPAQGTLLPRICPEPNTYLYVPPVRRTLKPARCAPLGIGGTLLPRIYCRPKRNRNAPFGIGRTFIPRNNFPPRRRKRNQKRGISRTPGYLFRSKPAVFHAGKTSDTMESLFKPTENVKAQSLEELDERYFPQTLGLMVNQPTGNSHLIAVPHTPERAFKKRSTDGLHQMKEPKGLSLVSNFKESRRNRLRPMPLKQSQLRRVRFKGELEHEGDYDQRSGMVGVREDKHDVVVDATDCRPASLCTAAKGGETRDKKFRQPGSEKLDVHSIANGRPTRIEKQDRREDPRGFGRKLHGFDGAGDKACQTNHTTQSLILVYNIKVLKYRHNNRSGLVGKDKNISMDRGISPSMAPKPLRIYKQHSQSQMQPPRSQLHLSDKNPYNRSISKALVYPPRSSSVRRHDNFHHHEVIHCEQSDQSRIKSQAASFATGGAHSTHSGYTGNHLSDNSSNRFSATTATQSVTDSFRSQYLSDSSSAILGDFIAVDSPDMANAPRDVERGNALGKVKKTVNPYEFEPGSPYDNLARQTTFTDFIQSQDEKAVPSQRESHMKNSRSEGNAMFVTQPSTLNVPLPKTSGQCLHRSESSPSVVPGRFHERRHRTPSPDIPRYYYGEDEEQVSPTQRGRQQAGADVPKLPSGRNRHEHIGPASRSPTRFQYQGHTKESGAKPSSHDCHPARSPTKALHDVVEHDEPDTSDYERVLDPPKKRSRSPMKKMFGEHGWLGQSPNEADDLELATKNSSIGKKQDTTKKTTVMGKIKNKLEEFAEKADLSPIRNTRSNSEKHPKLSMLSVSLSPPEQARVYMEVELMLVHTANSFLMNQFSQGRIAVDSIKKIVDVWKSRGRPIVIEFMYDQTTQRELVAVNQHNFRFHGERAGDGIRVNSMLYNWKQVAGLMAIRTFCSADTVILKLLFDVEQILELLGAAEGIMFRLQQIRASANENMRQTRQKNGNTTNTHTFINGREVSWESQHPSEDFSRKQSRDDPYGGMKLVPHSYTEYA